VSEPRARTGHRVDLLIGGDQYFPAVLDAIAQARREVLLETYQFFDDPTGQRVADALAAAARRGVDVRLMVDGFGADNLVPTLRARLLPAGVALCVYRPMAWWKWIARAQLRRMHRKLVVVDGAVAFCGGINVHDDRDGGDASVAPRYDFAVRVEGPLVADVHRSMQRLWKLVSWTQLARRIRIAFVAPTAAPVPGGVMARFVTRDNWRNRGSIGQSYWQAVQQAREEIVVSNAYFLPGRRSRRLLLDAARRGVRVRLLLQGRVEYFLVHHAMRALYGQFLDAGITIFDYQPAHLHAKVAVIDGHWATVGSSNIDPFSLFLSREANVVVEDEAFARQLRDELERAMRDDAIEIRADDWKKRPWPVQALDWVAFQAGRMAFGLTGYGK
jgi:cardiolipin synthase A/B